ncbi:unnamed protein product [Blepharisma stoltei]|uniref:Uncharacterized protein n=1 Tax=Blepharisma stoltei TaxID=1481888 RepID=A0AAU9JNR5_9CILI|nr:unnamed protein product [Blepharisma stoltei]
MRTQALLCVDITESKLANAAIESEDVEGDTEDELYEGEHQQRYKEDYCCNKMVENAWKSEDSKYVELNRNETTEDTNEVRWEAANADNCAAVADAEVIGSSIRLSRKKKIGMQKRILRNIKVTGEIEESDEPEETKKNEVVEKRKLLNWKKLGIGEAKSKEYIGKNENGWSWRRRKKVNEFENYWSCRRAKTV